MDSFGVIKALFRSKEIIPSFMFTKITNKLGIIGTEWHLFETRKRLD